MDPMGTTTGPTAIDPISLLQAEAYAVEVYQSLIRRFPEESWLGQCLDGHHERFLILEQWLHRQGVKKVLADDAGPFSHVPPDELAGSLDVALARLTQYEDALLEDYRVLPVVDQMSGSLREECLIGQGQTVQVLSKRRRHRL